MELVQRLQSRDMTQTAQEWLTAFAADVGLAASTREEFGQLLELAAIAANVDEAIIVSVACHGASQLLALKNRPMLLATLANSGEGT